MGSYLADVVNMDTSGLAALEELHKELACLGIQVSFTDILRFPTYRIEFALHIFLRKAGQCCGEMLSPLS